MIDHYYYHYHYHYHYHYTCITMNHYNHIKPNFLHAAFSGQRFLGLSFHAQRGTLGVEYRGRNVRIIVSHLSIEPEFVSAQLLDAQVAVEAARLRAKHGGTSSYCK